MCRIDATKIRGLLSVEMLRVQLTSLVAFLREPRDVEPYHFGAEFSETHVCSYLCTVLKFALLILLRLGKHIQQFWGSSDQFDSFPLLTICHCNRKCYFLARSPIFDKPIQFLLSKLHLQCNVNWREKLNGEKFNSQAVRSRTDNLKIRFSILAPLQTKNTIIQPSPPPPRLCLWLCYAPQLLSVTHF